MRLACSDPHFPHLAQRLAGSMAARLSAFPIPGAEGV
jgi:hypothetical protein